MNRSVDRARFSGIAGIGVLVFIVLLFLLLYGIDVGYIGYTKKCGETGPAECFLEPTPVPGPVEPTPIATPPAPMTATGSYTYSSHTVDITLRIPPLGGPVTGSVSGSCDGTVRGIYTVENGMLSGSMAGGCTVAIFPVPARATFSGSVSRSSDTVPIEVTGSAAGMSGSGTIVLTIR